MSSPAVESGHRDASLWSSGSLTGNMGWLIVSPVGKGRRGEKKGRWVDPTHRMLMGGKRNDSTVTGMSALAC